MSSDEREEKPDVVKPKKSSAKVKFRVESVCELAQVADTGEDQRGSGTGLKRRTAEGDTNISDSSKPSTSGYLRRASDGHVDRLYVPKLSYGRKPKSSLMSLWEETPSTPTVSDEIDVLDGKGYRSDSDTDRSSSPVLAYNNRSASLAYEFSRDIMLEAVNLPQNVDFGSYENTTTSGSIREVSKIISSGSGEEFDCDDSHIFCELFVYASKSRSRNQMAWLERARIVKYEESVDLGTRRWSPPHISLLTLPALLQLRSCFRKGTCHFNSNALSLTAVANEVMTAWDGAQFLDDEELDIVETILNAKTLHLKRRKYHHAIGQPAVSSSDEDTEHSSTQMSVQRENHLQEKIARRVGKNVKEAAAVFIARCPILTTSLAAFIRLKRRRLFPDLLEVQVPVRFFFFLFVPEDLPLAKCDPDLVGRAFGCLITDEVFTTVARRANSSRYLAAAVDEFIGQVLTIPSRQCTVNAILKPPGSGQVSRFVAKTKRKSTGIITEEMMSRVRDGLERTGVCFGGLIRDVERKKPFYKSDFADAFEGANIGSVIASIILIFIAVTTKLISFGFVAEAQMKREMGINEHLMSGAITGCIFALFSGQPLAVPSPAGAIMQFELTMYRWCKRNSWNFLPFRLWMGVWASVLMFVFTALDGSAIVQFATKFTQEPFAVMNSIFFMLQSALAVLSIGSMAKMVTQPTVVIEKVRRGEARCECVLYGNMSSDVEWYPYNYSDIYWKQQTLFHDCAEVGGRMVGDLCHFIPDVFMYSSVLFVLTFLLMYCLSSFKSANWISPRTSTIIAEYSAAITLFVMTVLYQVGGLRVPTFTLPGGLSPTKSERSWVVNPFAVDHWYLPLLAILPATMFALLAVLGQTITSAIVNRKENKLKKGYGYHLDLFILSWLVLLCSVLGLPILVCNPVATILHLESLKVWSEDNAPGEKPRYLGIREQRITNLASHLLVGMSVFMISGNTLTPTAVVFGVFFYMGFASMRTQRLFDRALLFVIPAHSQPDLNFLRVVPLRRVHLYTVCQLAAVALLVVVNYVIKNSILYPLAVILVMLTRKLLEKCRILTQTELEVLDGKLLPVRTVLRPSVAPSFNYENIERRGSNLARVENAERHQKDSEGQNLEHCQPSLPHRNRRFQNGSWFRRKRAERERKDEEIEMT